MSVLIDCILFLVLLLVCSEFITDIQGEDTRCEGLGGYLQTVCGSLDPHYYKEVYLRSDQNQDDMGKKIKKFSPLLQDKKCSYYIRRLLCFVYAPPCVRVTDDSGKTKMRSLKVCKDVCELAMEKCPSTERWATPEINQFWRTHDCQDDNVFPEKSFEGMPCMKDPPKPTIKKINEPVVEGKELAMECASKLKVDGYSIHFTDPAMTISNCSAPCRQEGFLFTNPNSRFSFSRSWIFAWSIICFLNTLFTLFTFLIDRSRFRYPERCIILIASCYIVVSLVFIIGFLSGYSIACTTPSSAKAEVITQGTRLGMCTFMFMFLYYFVMSSSIWWVMLGVSWFLSGTLKWGAESIEANAQWFHLIAWSLPALQTIAVLAFGWVDGDVLSGVCYTGVYNPTALKTLVITPLSIYLAVGIILLLVCFISLFRIRVVMKAERLWRTDKLERLMARIGTFSLLFVISVSVVIACHVYELTNYDSWVIGYQRRTCLTYRLPCPPKRKIASQPDFTIFMVKYLMTLSIGISSGFWVWTTKTVKSWQDFFHRCQCCFCGGANSTPSNQKYINNEENDFNQLAAGGVRPFVGAAAAGNSQYANHQQRILTGAGGAIPASSIDGGSIPYSAGVPLTGGTGTITATTTTAPGLNVDLLATNQYSPHTPPVSTAAVHSRYPPPPTTAAALPRQQLPTSSGTGAVGATSSPHMVTAAAVGGGGGVPVGPPGQFYQTHQNNQLTHSPHVPPHAAV